MCRRLQPIRQRFALPPDPPRSLRALQRMRHRPHVPNRRLPSRARQAAVSAQDHPRALSQPNCMSLQGEKEKGRKGEKVSTPSRGNSPFLPFSSAPFRFWLFLIAVMLVQVVPAFAESRFPPPDFTETNHLIPTTTTPAARAEWLQYLDVAVLLA